MEGAPGLNIARVASMQEHATGGGEDENISILSATSPFNMKGTNIISSISGNIDQGLAAIAQQPATLSCITSLTGGKPFSPLGIKIFTPTPFTFQSIEETAGISNTGEPLGADQGMSQESMMNPGMAMHESGTLFDGESNFNHIAPPSNTPIMQEQHRGGEMEVGG